MQLRVDVEVMEYMHQINFNEVDVIEESKDIVSCLCKIDTDTFASGHAS
jgi:hypothetical protein